MRNSRFVSRMAALMMSGLSAFGQAPGGRVLKDAWEAWRNGEIESALSLAEGHLASNHAVDEARHILFLTHYVRGEFETALTQYEALDEGYRGRGELAETVLDAYLFLGRIADALAFVRGAKGFPPWIETMLERQSKKPFRASLDGQTIVPFAEHPLTEYFPAFSVEVNGEPELAHIDTGGDYLIMGPDRAKKLGIETISAGKGQYHLDLKSRPVALGVAERFVIGDAVLENVPVTVVPTLVEDGDFIIFGTRILHEFFTTLDYPRSRMLLSPRGDAAMRDAQLAMMPGGETRVPFYLWGDHFMFARGNFGEKDKLNFFVDSGLVVIRPGADGEARQAGMTTSKRKLAAWGVPRDAMRPGFIVAPSRIGLGPLQQTDHVIEIGAAGDNNFGGVRIDGLISHGFLKEYAWSIDFDTREFVFRANDE